MKKYDTIRFCHTGKRGKIEVIATWRDAEISGPINYLEGFLNALAFADYSKRLMKPMVMALDGYMFWREDRDHNQVERWWLEDGDGNAL